MERDLSSRRTGPGRRFPARDGARLRAALVAEHRRAPFSPADVRGSAHRALAVAEDLGMPGHVARGGLGVGWAELDHVWAVVDGRVVDVSLPVVAVEFRRVLRAYVAGDVEAADITRMADEYPLEWRVIGDVPGGCRYRGQPVLAHRTRDSGSRAT